MSILCIYLRYSNYGHDNITKVGYFLMLIAVHEFFFVCFFSSFFFERVAIQSVCAITQHTCRMLSHPAIIW